MFEINAGTPGQLLTEPGDAAQPSLAGQCAEPTPGGSGTDARETVGSSSDSAVDRPSLVNTSTDSPAVDQP